MYNLVKSNALSEILKKPMPRNSLRDGGATNNSAGDTNKTTGNPSPIPEEFVPAPEKTEERSLCADLSKINKLFDFLESSRTDDVDLGNTVVDGVGMENLSTAVEAWKEVPNRNLKISFGDPEEFMDNLDFMRISRRKAKITFEKAREKRLEQERMAALEATKLTEEKSMEDPSSVPVPVPGNDSPIHFSAEERTEVDRMQAVKEGEEDQEASGSVVALTPKRYIPTDKEWDEQCRFKAQKSPTTVDQMPPATTMTAKRYIPTTKEWDEQCRFKMETEMNATLPTKKLEAESRNGNITHYGANVAPTPMESQPIEGEQKDRQVKKGNVIRYTIEELLKLEPQPEDLEVPAEVALINNNLLKDT
ncbi:uncharacterized protein LOC27208711 [Drosophila simulans]|uniref:uncharacterized protein LOC27208711 n=1 Tax=Drosophila simulans TaxID=7240 RepID=UPI00078AE37C|nr:uncharacterized protein LOC27208711 [Drosophila simulans]KMZ10189.1 uncharacterized protein Dsimw501_GD28868 [Drosophila simulans]